MTAASATGKAAKREEIAAHDFVLTPGRYVGAEAVEDDGVPFEEKMAVLTQELGEQFKVAAELETKIKHARRGIGFSQGLEG